MDASALLSPPPSRRTGTRSGLGPPGAGSARSARMGVRDRIPSGQMGQCTRELPGRCAGFRMRARGGVRGDAGRVDHRRAQRQPASAARTPCRACSPTVASGVARRRPRRHPRSPPDDGGTPADDDRSGHAAYVQHRVRTSGRRGRHPVLLRGGERGPGDRQPRGAGGGARTVDRARPRGVPGRGVGPGGDRPTHRDPRSHGG
jgi:hypothetical protein